MNRLLVLQYVIPLICHATVDAAYDRRRASIVLRTAAIFLLACLSAPPALVAEGLSQELVRTGLFNISLTSVEILGESGAQLNSQLLAVDKPIEWQVYVPESYKAEEPAGAMVFVSASNSGGIPRSWKEVMDAHNLIWISANDAGNKYPVAERMMKAILAPQVLARNYVLNPERVYISGFSGGGKTATKVASAKPGLFKGAVYMAGSVSWDGGVPEQFGLIKKNRHVFLVGARDFALRSVRRVYRDYKTAGVENVELIIILNYEHRLPPAHHVERAIAYLDSKSS